RHRRRSDDGGALMRPGSYRGVPFLVEGSAELELGRRTVKTEYPLRDEHSTKDLGRRARSYQLECLVLGAAYETRRDALIAAFEEAGPARLVHPFWGELRVMLNG